MSTGVVSTCLRPQRDGTEAHGLSDVCLRDGLFECRDCSAHPSRQASPRTAPGEIGLVDGPLSLTLCATASSKALSERRARCWQLRLSRSLIFSSGSSCRPTTWEQRASLLTSRRGCPRRDGWTDQAVGKFVVGDEFLLP